VAELRIVQLTGSSTGGVARHARELATGLDRGGHRVILAGPPEVIAEAAVRTERIDISDRPRPGDARAVRQIRRLAQGADIVHAHGLRAGALAALAIGAKDRARLVITWHNKPVGAALVTAVGAGLERLNVRAADVILGVSGDLVSRAQALGAAHAERALVPAPPGPPGNLEAQLTSARADLGLRRGDQVVLTVARLAPQKGLGLLADTAALLADRAPRARWLLAGAGPMQADLAEQIEAEALPVELLGNRGDVRALLALADVVVSTSSWEGQPLNLQEALQAGAPIVATDVGGTGEVTGPAARLVPDADPDALVTQIVAVLSQPELAAQMRAAAAQRATELPDAADSLDQILGLYHRVIG